MAHLGRLDQARDGKLEPVGGVEADAIGGGLA
jgi:hypothetical protein